MWYRVIARICGFAACASVVALAAQWLSISFGWDPLVGTDTVDRWTDRIGGPLREGPAMLAAIGVVAAGGLCFGAWLLTLHHPMRDDTFRAGTRRDRVRIDRDSLAASLERRLEHVDQRVDASVQVSRRGRVDLRVVTPDPSVSGPAAEHAAELGKVLTERGLPCRVRKVDIVDVRRVKSRHRVR
jgi:hypothetical protein